MVLMVGLGMPCTETSCGQPVIVLYVFGGHECAYVVRRNGCLFVSIPATHSIRDFPREMPHIQVVDPGHAQACESGKPRNVPEDPGKELLES